MGYTYPDLVNNPSNTTLVASIKAQYSDAPKSKARTRRQEAMPAKGLVYLAEVKLPVFGFSDGKGSSQPYNVFTFLGDVPSDPKQWLHADSFVAITSTIGGRNMDNDQSTIITVDLTEALAKNGKASDDAAVEFLKENLHWRLGLVSISFKHEVDYYIVTNVF
jgi:tyrosinase